VNNQAKGGIFPGDFWEISDLPAARQPDIFNCRRREKIISPEEYFSGRIRHSTRHNNLDYFHNACWFIGGKHNDRTLSSPPDREERVEVVSRPGGYAQRRVVHNTAAEQRLFISRFAQVIWLLFGFLEALIGIRVLLKLIGANPEHSSAR